MKSKRNTPIFVIFGFLKLKDYSHICAIGFLMVFFGVSCKPVGEKQKDKPGKHNTEMHFEKSLHAFGKVKTGETVGCYFSFTNTGNHPLIISKVKPGCGCTTVLYPKEPVLPGKDGEIEVRFDSKGFRGHQYKVIQIYANIKNSMKELVVSANVIN